MLASLLPGLREVRTPLTAGYLWLLCVWLLAADYLPRTAEEANAFVRPLFELGGLLGASAVLAALSFSAYLLGSLLYVSLDNRVIRVTLSRLRTRFFRISSDIQREYVDWMFEESGARARTAEFLSDTVSHFAEEAGIPSKNIRPYFDTARVSARRVDPTDDAKEIYGRELMRMAKGKFAKIERETANNRDRATRLMVKSPTLYGEYDRFSAEALFRLNITLPILVLGVVAGWRWAPAAGAVTVVVAWALVVQALARSADADAIIWQAMMVGELVLPDNAVRDRVWPTLRDELLVSVDIFGDEFRAAGWYVERAQDGTETRVWLKPTPISPSSHEDGK